MAPDRGAYGTQPEPPSPRVVSQLPKKMAGTESDDYDNPLPNVEGTGSHIVIVPRLPD